MLNDDIFQSGLAELGDINQIHLCSQEPATYAEVATYTLANKESPTIGSSTDRTGGGRERIVAAITDYAETGTGTATHIVGVDSATSRLMFTKALPSSIAVPFSGVSGTQEFGIGFGDPAE